MSTSSAEEERSRDGLSELPDELLVHILSFLPTIEAVRTVILRRFGNLWTLVQSLHFSDDHPCFKSSCCFFGFVGNVLIHHNRPTITKFYLKLHNDPMMSVCIKNRSLTWCCDHVFIPSDFFRSKSLVSLELKGCEIEHSRPVDMGSLRKLTLESVHMDDKMLKEIISGCPCLEELNIVKCFRLSDLCIISPSLKRLNLSMNIGWVLRTLDCPNLKLLDIHFHLADYAEAIDVREIGVQSHCEVKISVCCGDQFSTNNFISILGALGKAQTLTLTSAAVHQLAHGFMKELAFPHNRWKHFIVRLRVHEACILGICRLLRNSPCLEELSIYADIYMENDDEPTQFSLHCKAFEIINDLDHLVHDLSPPCVLPRLKIVTFRGFVNPHHGLLLQMAEFLHKSGVNLEKLLFVSQ